MFTPIFKEPKITHALAASSVCNLILCHMLQFHKRIITEMCSLKYHVRIFAVIKYKAQCSNSFTNAKN